MNNMEAMREAIAAMRRSTTSDASDPHVGAVISRDGQYFSQEHTPLAHAEYLLLKRLSVEQTAGATLYTTLEPCTFRGIDKHGELKTSCADFIVEKKIAKVMIGMLDPNPYILGNGVLRLREKGIEVGLFPPDLMAKIEAVNLPFRQAFGLSSETSGSPQEADILGKWIVTTTFEDGTTTDEELYLRTEIGNRCYGVMINRELDQKYDFFMIQVTPKIWDYSFRSKRRAKQLDHGAGIVCFDSKDSARALGAAHGAFSKCGKVGTGVSVVMKRASA